MLRGVEKLALIAGKELYGGSFCSIFIVIVEGFSSERKNLNGLTVSSKRLLGLQCTFITKPYISSVMLISEIL
jgi:hypothetical protein